MNVGRPLVPPCPPVLGELFSSRPGPCCSKDSKYRSCQTRKAEHPYESVFFSCSWRFLLPQSSHALYSNLVGIRLPSSAFAGGWSCSVLIPSPLSCNWAVAVNNLLDHEARTRGLCCVGTELHELAIMSNDEGPIQHCPAARGPFVVWYRIRRTRTTTRF